MVFSQTLPDDYSEKTIPIKTGLKNIRLKALHPVDIVATKIGRLDERDLQDIKACIERFGLTKKQVQNSQSALNMLDVRRIIESICAMP